ncbi:hypothetical protein BJ742DRAFT_909385 [Cladochytrium replicatum]|nr:hypothetical protein BJ742DRAFT_909385 [Cladochytrium replicatum]
MNNKAQFHTASETSPTPRSGSGSTPAATLTGSGVPSVINQGRLPPVGLAIRGLPPRQGPWEEMILKTIDPDNATEFPKASDPEEKANRRALSLLVQSLNSTKQHHIEGMWSATVAWKKLEKAHADKCDILYAATLERFTTAQKSQEEPYQQWCDHMRSLARLANKVVTIHHVASDLGTAYCGTSRPVAAEKTLDNMEDHLRLGTCVGTVLGSMGTMRILETVVVWAEVGIKGVGKVVEMVEKEAACRRWHADQGHVQGQKPFLKLKAKREEDKKKNDEGGKADDKDKGKRPAETGQVAEKSSNWRRNLGSSQNPPQLRGKFAHLQDEDPFVPGSLRTLDSKVAITGWGGYRHVTLAHGSYWNGQLAALPKLPIYVSLELVEFISQFKVWHVEVANQTGLRLRILRIDREFALGAVAEYARYAIIISNCSPKKSQQGMTPYACCYGKKPDEDGGSSLANDLRWDG